MQFSTKFASLAIFFALALTSINAAPSYSADAELEARGGEMDYDLEARAEWETDPDLFSRDFEDEFDLWERDEDFEELTVREETELVARGFNLIEKYKKHKADKKWDAEISKAQSCILSKCLSSTDVAASKKCTTQCGEETKKRHPELYAQLKKDGVF